MTLQMVEREQELEHLVAYGFDQSYMAAEQEGLEVCCSQCEALVICGIACHESGCPNTVFECKGCFNFVGRKDSYCQECSR